MTVIEAELIERLRFQVMFARAALMTITVLNGAGLLLALWRGGDGAPCYLGGCVAACLAYLGAFVSQGLYYAVTAMEARAEDGRIVDHLAMRRLHIRGARAERAAVGLAAFSLLLFLLGTAAA